MPATLYGDRFIGRGKPAWHNLGKVFEQERRLTVSQAFQEAKLDYDLTKYPMYVKIGGTEFEVSDQVLLVRDANNGEAYKPISVVHKNYPYFQNMEVAAMLDPFSDERNGGWPVETAGALNDGETLFVTLKAATFGVGPKADPVEDYYLFTDNRNGGECATVAWVGLRVVCANTLMAALSGANRSIKIKHYHGSFRDVAKWSIETMARLKGITATTHEQMNLLGYTPMTKDQVKEMLSKLWPEPKKPEQSELLIQAQAAGQNVTKQIEDYKARVETWAKRQEKIQEIRSDVLQLYGQLTQEFEVAATAGTAWHAYNAVTQWASTYKGREIQKSVMFGERGEIIEKAFAFSMAAAEASKVSAPSAPMTISVPSNYPTQQPVAQPVTAVWGKATNGSVADAPSAPSQSVKVDPSTLTPEQRANNAIGWLKQQSAAKYTDDMINATLRRCAVVWVQGTQGGSDFVQSIRGHILLKGADSLSNAQVRGVLNTMLSQK